MHMKKLLLSLVAITLFTSLSAQYKSADDCIQSIIKGTNAVGLSIAVVKKDQVIYANSYGWKSMENKTPLTNDCLFRIASISKSFSATSIMQLVKAGKLHLNDDVSDLVGFKVRNPKYPETVITLAMLMQHRSSINDSQGYFSLDFIDPATNSNWQKCYNDYEPGKGYQYCNLNFNMVGTIIERASGERFDQYVKHHVLDPLGLYGGYCVDSLDKSRFASIYEYNADSAKYTYSPAAYAPRSEEIAHYVMGRSTPIFSPTGGMKISATDLARYMIMHKNLGKANGKRIIPKKYSKLMQEVYSDEEGYGMALETTSKLIPGVTLTGHTGSAYGLYSAMFFNKKEDYGIVVICNGCSNVYNSGFNAFIGKAMKCLYEEVVMK